MATLNVLVTGGSSASGVAAARGLALAGHRVFTVGSDPARIAAAAEQAGDGVTPLVCDLASLDAVRELAAEVHAAAGPVDGVLHLVGGWRGATGIEDQPDEDWDVLSTAAVTTLRNVSRVFYRDLADSPAGRLAMVSSTAVASPTAAAATYAAAKAAAEAWTFAVADGFRKEQSGAKENPVEQHSAAVVFAVKALVDARMRQAQPERKFPGFTDVEDLAAAAVGLFKQPAAELNGQRILLAP
ncbi:oxidoreductase [Arthrobacter sp. SW1]|uniref:SDR family NAD(P)-dependent oxidoreductase n=1 Tax=Arthrobacter sp. SW1 TaxID=1920889 RepID=UPI000877E40B|nr:SDR family NAD(P)-dependent oxidoreductase [Arthrobacter sp. SW1]OFI39027.1 oxidoreductase [Arthrobacter sp. SW1]